MWYLFFAFACSGNENEEILKKVAKVLGRLDPKKCAYELRFINSEYM